MTQFVKCRFAPDDKRKYTYHHDGEPVAPGDMVRVETKDGTRTIEVVEVGDEKPNFKTKPILCKVEPKPESEAADAPARPESEANAAPAEPESMKAAPDCCEEASPASGDSYVPCNKPATREVGLDGRVYRMCDACADHNVKGRGGRDLGEHTPGTVIGRAVSTPDPESARGLGDNRPPPYDVMALEDLEPKVREFADAAGEWLDIGEITDEEQAGKLNDFVTGCRRLWKQIHEKRRADKEPHLEAGRQVDAAWKRLLEPLERAADRVKPLLNAYANKKAAEQERQRQETIEKARQEAEEARKAAEAAESRHDVVGESEAAEKLAAAEKAEKEAARTKTTGQIASATGGGRTAALRTYRSAKITGPKQAVVWALTNYEAEVMELVERLANRAIREGAQEIPGVQIVEEKRVA